METKININKIIGLKKSDFDQSVKTHKGIRLRRARLIPLSKPGDEMTLTSIFLASLKLVDEFKKQVFKELKLHNGGKMYVYTEVSFPNFEDSRIDGLILVVVSGKIIDAALLEMKNKNSELEKPQVDRYIQIAKELKIPKLVTISNQFVSESTQSPLQIKPPKSVTVFHLLWSYILTIAHLLLFKNDMNIRDEDQVRIMEEIVAFFESPVSGVSGVTQMKAGWDELTKGIHLGSHFAQNDQRVKDAVMSWHQQERDMALKLSQKVGVLVKTGQAKYKTNLSLRINDDSKQLVKQKTLISTLKVFNAVSDIRIQAFFEKKSVEMSVKVTIPKDKTIKGQIGWMKRQILNCEKKSLNASLSKTIDEFITKELYIDIDIKFAQKKIRVPFSALEDIYNEIKEKEINYFRVVFAKDFKGAFTAPKKFVSTLETMLLDYYKGFVEHLVNWNEPTPKVVENNYYSNIDHYIENMNE